MDLEGFDDAIPPKKQSFQNSPFYQVIDSIDNEWYTRASRSARWMDLLGDYAGSEPFVIDGEALFQIILDDPLLSIGREDCAFQILHAYYMLECTLGEYQKRSANFQVVFWQKNLHLSLQTGRSAFTVASRALARSMLFKHLLKLPFEVHVFDDLADPSWVQYVNVNKPMFIMTNDGGLYGDHPSNSTAAAILCQRIFLLQILSSSAGIAVALLKGTEYRESKILTFVFEPSPKNLDLLKSLGGISRAADDHLCHTLFQGVQGIQYNLPTSGCSAGGVDVESRFFQELDILSPIRKGVPPEIIFIFITHTLVIPTLSLREMAQVYQPLCPELTNVIRQEFLPVAFSNAANVLGSYDYPLAVDGTIYLTLIAFVLSRHGELRTAIDSALFSNAESLWATIGGPRLNFSEFAKRYPTSGSKELLNSIQYRTPKPAQLLEFSNPLFDEEFSVLEVSSEGFEPDSPKSGMYFEPGIILPDKHHWHNQKSILPSHQGGSKPKPENPRARFRRLRSDQRFMATMQVQASSLTGAFGASLQRTVILPVGSARKGKQPLVRQKVVASLATDKPQVLSSTEKLRLKIKEEKEAKQKDTSASKWKHYLSTFSNYTLEQKIASVDESLRRPKSDAPAIDLEMRLFRLHLEFERWLEEPDRDSDRIRDLYTVAIMRMIKDICHNKVLTLSTKQVLTTVLTALGFEDYVSQMFTAVTYLGEQRLGFSFIKLLDSKTRSPRYNFMSITEHPAVWQLRLFGEYMDRSMDSSPDKRVAFEPDAWQKKVLDAIDKSKSLLVVAPTSAGKTFISYYAMEKLLRESDDGILVYIAPTKALVTQIAAEVYARFSKDLNGKSCWAIHTRDFRIHNPQSCQILITVPEMLAIMLLSPPLARVWTPRIKRIILDEIHCIGQQEGGAVWEQIILFAPCPIVGLSATIGSPGTFSDWLASVQRAHGFEYEFIEHHHRYSHLRKFFYRIDGKGCFDKYKTTDRFSFLHPISLLSFGPRALPPDLSLEARDTLTLYKALVSVQDQIAADIGFLDPKNFFSTALGFLRQKDVLEYESKLKEVLIELMKSFDPCDVSSPLGKVVHSLQDPITADATTPSPTAFKNDLLVLLADLSAKNELPAILFNFNRTSCEIMAQYILQTLERLEGEWRSGNPQWNRRVKEWECWRDQAKARERVHEKLERRRKTHDQECRDQDSSEQSWQSSFDPNDPSPEFSFAGRRSSLDLENHIKDLSWTSIPQWAFDALRRGIAVHHSGMNKHYRSLVESLFRQGSVQVVIATGTLALGINAPTKTVVFCGDSPYLTALMYRQCAGRAGRRGFDLRGNVVFYGLPADRVRRLVLSRLPTLGGNFPATATMALRLFNLLDGSKDSDFATHVIRSLVSLPQITVNVDIGRDQLLHHLRFSVEYLRRSGLLDKSGKPINLFVIAAHLYYTEPSNLALVTLMRHGVLHKICDQPDRETAKRELMILLCNLFGRKYLPKNFSNESNIKALASNSPSMILLPPLPETAENVLSRHEKEILRIYKGYAAAFVRQHQTKMGPDNILPLSGLQYPGSDKERSSPFRVHLSNNAIPVVVRSSFVANSGHADFFKSVLELTTTARSGLNLNGHAIPSMSHFTSSGQRELEHRLNAHILDFYIHGQVPALIRANGIRRGDIWYLLQDFMLTLMTIQSGMLQLLLTVSKNTSTTSSAEEADLKTYNVDYDEPSDGPDEDSNCSGKPENVSTRDWNVYMVLSEICSEFEEKFRAMWA